MIIWLILLKKLLKNITNYLSVLDKHLKINIIFKKAILLLVILKSLIFLVVFGVINNFLVRTGRLELPRVAPHAPQACAYTNSATSAKIIVKCAYTRRWRIRK